MDVCEVVVRNKEGYPIDPLTVLWIVFLYTIPRAPILFDQGNLAGIAAKSGDNQVRDSIV